MSSSVTKAIRVRAPGLEWGAVCALVADHAATLAGRELALAAIPHATPDAVLEATAGTTAGRRALAALQAPPLGALPDIRRVLARVSPPGVVLDGLELKSVGRFAALLPAITTWGRAIAAAAPELARRVAELPAVGSLAAALERALDDEGALRDGASPLLGRLRQDIRARQQRIQAALEGRVAAASGDASPFADRFVTVRNGRYVVPVRASAARQVRGIVHDRSQSGQTLFVEPDEFLDANNGLVERTLEEAAEAARILAELTGAVRAHAGDLERAGDELARLDWILARARLAERLGAVPAGIARDGVIRLRGARHPLLVAQGWGEPGRSAVVPIDLELAPDRPLLLVTGPNAGGKTLALKTLGLAVLMAQAGCHVPAEPGASLPVFTRLEAVIGDDQSVAENLSTFSAFVRRVQDMLAVAGPGTLVLLDELGAGTDPDEGAALGQAILEELAARGALVAATTHLEPLKTFASTYSRARNAAAEFDTETLAPTFRLVYDRPGRSWAFEIAARHGLSPGLLDRAARHRSEAAARLGELVAALDARARQERERAAELERQEIESATRLAAARAAEAEATRRARLTVDEARGEAERLVRDVRRAVNETWELLRREDRSRQKLEAARRRLADVRSRATGRQLGDLAGSGPAAPDDGAPLRTGARVEAPHLGLIGDIVAIDAGTATVRAGSVTLRMPLAALQAVSPSTSRAPRQTRPRPEAVVSLPGEREVTQDLRLLGLTREDAAARVADHLDRAFLAGLPTVRLVHGKGTGALRRAVRELLATHPLVASFRDGEPAEGGAGATVAALKVD